MNTRFPIWRARSASAARLLLLAWALLAGAPAYAELPPPVAAALARQRVPESAVALWVQPLGGRGALLSHQPDRAMNPASVMKLVTSFAAFDVLGPTHTWKTRVFADAVPQQGVVEGNLYIVGEGDPAFSLERLWRLLRGLRAQGVGEVRGNLVLDRSAWPLPAFDPMAFDGRGHRPYNTGADALLMNFAALKLSFVPGGDGHPPRLLADPPLAGVAVVSALHLGRGACGDWDERLAVEVLQPADQQTA